MKKTTARRIGRFVRTARTEMELSQEALARKLGVTRGFVSDIERGARAISVETLIALSQKLHAPTDKILGRSAA